MRTPRKFFYLLTSICATTLSAISADLNIPENVLFEKGIEYANPDGQHLQANIARPKGSADSLPCII